MYLSISMPLGTPYDTDPVNVKAMTTLTAPSSTSSKDSQNVQKVAGWKPIPYHGRSSLSLSLREFVRSAQWGHSFLTTTCYGSLQVKAQLEGHNTDVTLTLSTDPSVGDLPLSLRSMIFHPCLHNITLANPENIEARKLKFRPPLHPISLCSFAFDPKEPPVGGIYEVSAKTKTSTQITIQLTLRLSSRMKNNFEFFNVKLPFPNRSPIRHASCTPTFGMIQLTEEKQSLLWNIGQSFPSKQEVTLKAEIQFENAKTEKTSDPSNTSNNSASLFAQINFLVKDFSLSGCFINPKGVQISPVVKTNIQTDRELRSTDYKIWNRNGDVPFCTETPSLD